MTDTYVRDAENIWNDFKHRINSDAKFKALSSEAQLSFYQKNYHQFTMLFPVILRYMIQMRSYNSKAFRKFINRLQSNPYKSRLEFCERQADYAKYLFMETSKSHNMKEAQQVWQQTYDGLAREVEAFKQADEIVKQRLNNTEQKNKQERREELIKMVQSLTN